MVLNSCILIRVKHGKINSVSKAIEKVKNLQVAFKVHGRYDIVVFVKGDTHDQVADIVRKIHQISGISKTETAIEM